MRALPHFATLLLRCILVFFRSRREQAIADDRASREARRAEMLETYDADGDGRVSRTGRDTARSDGAQVGRPGGDARFENGP